MVHHARRHFVYFWFLFLLFFWSQTSVDVSLQDSHILEDEEVFFLNRHYFHKCFK